MSDSFFEQYANSRYMDNKAEKRPHYFAIPDKTGVLWMIPLSSRVEKYKALIQVAESKHGRGRCVKYMVLPIYGKDRAFLICDMFPVLPEHVLRPYTLNGSPYVMRNKKICNEIRRKALAYLNMVESGALHSDLDILETKAKLLKHKEGQS